MCILCIIQKWSRKFATMLPWLVIPMIGLWALSQLFSPAFRFEITTTRLACVSVLLITLFWYEILMPNLSSWRIKRSAQIRERKRFEAIEMQKLRKTATRRCRNCLTPYKEQNPCGGKFMCSYCGHVSKRPVLDLPVPPGLSSSKIWKDWIENGNFGSVHFSENGNICRKIESECRNEREKCGTDVPYSFFRMIYSYFQSGNERIWRIITRGGSNRDDVSLKREILEKKGDNAGNLNESRGEKARRKAEEKKQARLERELMEEEERMQREEVARLVEEQRKLRDEKINAEKEICRSVLASEEKERKKEAERKRKERRKEKDIGSSKSNSDVEELEKRAGKESDRKRDFEKKSENTAKNYNIDTAHLHKNNYNRGTGTRYLDRMKGTILSSSKALGGGNFFGRGSNNISAVSREKKANASVDPFHHSANIREFTTPVKSSMNVEDKAISRPVSIEPQPTVAPKKSWGQLFTRSPAPITKPNVICRPSVKSQVEVQSPPFTGHSPSGQIYEKNPINFGVTSPFSLPSFSYAPATSCTVPPLTSEVRRDYLPEDNEIFGEPCYIPDPVSLLGPVSESLDNFQLDLGPNFSEDIGLERPGGALKRISTAEVNRPSPIESPISRLPAAPNINKLPNNNNNINQNRTWQMWESSPLGQDGLGLVSGGTASLFSTDNQAFSRAQSPQKIFSGNIGHFGSPVSGSTGDPWLPATLFSQNEMISGSPNSSAKKLSSEASHANGWAKNDRVSSSESTGSSSSTKPHIGGLYSSPDKQSLWSYD